jgi:hypothetical protein
MPMVWPPASESQQVSVAGLQPQDSKSFSALCTHANTKGSELSLSLCSCHLCYWNVKHAHAHDGTNAASTYFTFGRFCPRKNNQVGSSSLKESIMYLTNLIIVWNRMILWQLAAPCMSASGQVAHVWKMRCPSRQWHNKPQSRDCSPRRPHRIMRNIQILRFQLSLKSSVLF